MTVTADGLDAARVVEVGGIPMSALVRQVAQPRAVIVALHGGAASARYFHHPGPRLSLLDTAAALGFTVLAIDRPGYGRSAPYESTMDSPDFRVGLAYATVDALLGDAPRGAGLFLFAHSAGSELTIRMAAAERGRDLLGIEVAGTGRHWHDRAAEIIASAQPGRPTGIQSILWEPRELYPPESIGGRYFAGPGPAYEGALLKTWSPRDFALVAPQVSVPVQYTLGDHDHVWRNDPASMADIAALFSASPRVLVNLQAHSGHNLSVGRTAAAYHLKVLSFVEECVVAHAERKVSTENIGR